MIEILTTALTYLALAAATWAAVLVIANKPVQLREWHGLWLYCGLVLLEVGLLVQLVAGVVNMIGDDRAVDALAFLGYLVTPLVIVPLAGFWALAERTRWGPSVIVFGCLTIPVLIIRLQQVWNMYV